ncbi:MAG: phosphomannomutase/phosphoglucomutase [Ruminococcus sp.]|nr:phosphomannomutase/phosphoglucomutase [Ruminococcus sp.]
MNPSIFREYDIRGTYPSTINETVAYTIGKSYGSYLREKLNQTTCIVSHDNRVSSPAIAAYLTKGITDSGLNVYNYGMTTTPMHYYARYIHNLFGIMVTASHNPKDDNGFKFSFDNLANARGSMIEDFKNYTLAGKYLDGNGTVSSGNITDKYVEFLKYGVEFGRRKRKVVIDVGNGTTSIVARRVFESVNVDFEIIYEESDGRFPNHHPDPSVEANLEALKKEVINKKADLGIAFDGDGDRLGIVDEKGNVVPNDHFMILIIRNIINTAKNKTFLYDVKCTKALEDEIKRLGGTPVCYRTGASYTQAKVKEDNMPFGGEYSGHFFFRDKIADVGSGIYAGLRLIEILSKTNEPLSKLLADIPKYYSTPEIKFPSPDEKKFEVMKGIKDFCESQSWVINAIDGIRVNFKTGWALVRASNTGPNITMRCEATTEDGLKNLQTIFTNLINTYNK